MNLSSEMAEALNSPQVKAIFAAFPKDSIRIVGGAVRNALLSEPISDIDFATQLTPDEVLEALEMAKVQAVKTGFEHGTITAVIDKSPFEITSLRKDVETDGRRAVVSYTKDWAEDAQRRDFTINALYLDQAGEIFDPTGQGLDDIKSKKLRFIGKAEDRIAEDYLRILRYFRFAAHYLPHEKMDAAALKACREGRAGLKSLSAERVWSELKKLLSAKSPERIVHIMLQQDILETLLPEASNAEGLEKLVRLEAREAIKPDPLLRLMSMAARDPLSIMRLTKRLKMSGKEAGRIKAWALDNVVLDPNAPDKEKLAAIYWASKQVVLDRARLRAAGEANPIMSSRWMSLADLAMGWTRPVFPMSGNDLINEGVSPGEGLGRRLKALEKLWVRSGFTADRKRLIAALKLMGG